ncbi:hypothetical protein CEP51_008215 [Fusarium floridanum]|uniref:ABC transporter domain-containing protein n=1 Tax=Fusarium floridanum TaxID=1325733 RepID=A0A428RLN2_9HYPO|nr:hypothetical protein CEP51_008215 [Fusarium floridanum]
MACVLEQHHPRRFVLAMFVGTSAMLIAACISLDMTLPIHTKRPKAQHVLSVCQVVLATATTIICALVPRRSPHFDADKVIDRQYAVSLLERISFSWAGPVMRSIISNLNIGDDELPRLHHTAQSAMLEEQFRSFASHKSLSVMLARIHFQGILQAVVLLLLFAALSFTPQVVFFMLLRSLEAWERQLDGHGYTSWGWVPTLGLCILLSSTVETWLNWISASKLSIPLSAQLSSAIFNKVTRIPIEANNAALDANQNHEAQTGDSCSKTGRSGAETESSSSAALIAYDVQRISDFAAIAPMLPLTILKSIMACILLKYLIGWKSMLAGVGTFLITFPANIIMSDRYTKVQMKLMALRDSRTATTTEFLHGIQQIKLSALEDHWKSVIAQARNLELAIMLSAVSLATYALTHASLPPSIAFTALAVLGELEIWTALLPILSAQLLQSKASIGRIKAFLKGPEMFTLDHDTEDICFRQAALAWPSRRAIEHREAILPGITLRIKSGELAMITGGTGPGKSLILHGILGECHVIQGTIQRATQDMIRTHSAENNCWLLKHTTAFVPQNPWIEAGTLRENILFGLPCNEGRYQQVLSACALLPDLKALPDGDRTNLGSNRVNLSGGQKMRVALARALYSRADILVLDDILGGVDVGTRHHLVQFAITGDLVRGRTRVLATHHSDDCLHSADHVYRVENGHVYEEDKQQLLKALGEIPREHPSSQPRLEQGTHEQDIRSAEEEGAAVDEQRSSGAFKLGALRRFVQAGTGIVLITMIMATSGAYLALFLGRGFWVASWTRTAQRRPIKLNLVVNTDQQHGTNQLHNANMFHLQVYLAISLGMCLVSTVRYFVLLKVNINASRYLFDRMLAAVISLPLGWFDTMPIGRIINRFTADFQSIDSNLGKNLGSATYGVLQIFAIILAATLALPVMLLPALILLSASAAVCYRYLKAAREMKRLEAVARSPILDLLLSVTEGLATIRGFGRVACYVNKMHQAIDRRTRALWHLSLFNAWLSFRLNMIGAVFATLAALLIIWAQNLDASVAGFALSFVLQLTAATDFALRRYASLELDMNALERVLEFTQVETEIESEAGGVVPVTWPTQGLVQMCNITARYKPKGPDVLRNVSLTLQPGQRVGIVGRTGAGKSSLVLALFRLLHLSTGSILIDDVDISTIDPRILRSRLAIVPQDPMLFSGTIRYNLDPDDQFNDSELLDLLRRIWQTTSRQDDDSLSFHTPIPSLDTPVDHGGSNFSQGERQLLHLVRALIRRPKVLVLDEATSALDFHTDEHIRRILHPEYIRRYLGGLEMSLLVVAHRLRTVADFDQVVVMQDGEVVETGRPRELLADMVKDDDQQQWTSAEARDQRATGAQKRG